MTNSDPILTIDGVAKSFGGLRVVEDLSFSVRRGSCTGLIGPNGLARPRCSTSSPGSIRSTPAGFCSMAWT